MQTTGYTNPKLTRMRNKGAAKPCGPCDTDCAPCTTECAPCNTVGAGPISRPYYPPQITPRTPPPGPAPEPGKVVIVDLPTSNPNPGKVFVLDQPTSNPAVPLPLGPVNLTTTQQGAPDPDLIELQGNRRSASDILGIDLVPMNLFGQSGVVAVQRQQYGSSGSPAPATYSGSQAEWDALTDAQRSEFDALVRAKATLLANRTSGATNQTVDTTKGQTTVAAINLIRDVAGGSFEAAVTSIREGNATERERIRRAAEVQIARLRGIQNDMSLPQADRDAAALQAQQVQALRDQLAAQSSTMTTVLIAGGAVLGIGALGVIGYKLLSGPKATTASSGKAIARRKR